MSKLGRIVRTLIFLVMTAALVAATAWGSAPQCKAVTYHLQGEIFEGSAANLQELVRVAKLAGINELLVEIDSPGGDADEGLKLYHVIHDAGIHTTCRGGDVVASAAFLAFQACDRRIVSPNTALMTHRVYGVVQSPIVTPELAQKMATELGALATTMDSLIAARLQLTLPQYLEHVARGKAWEMTGAEAVAAHAADVVNSPNLPTKTTPHASSAPPK